MLLIQSTNQQPVQFEYNVEIFNNDNSTIEATQSGYWSLNEINGTYVISDTTKTIYDNSPLTNAGIYLVKGRGKEKTDDYFKSFLDDLIYTLVFWLIAFVITIFAF